MSQFKFNVNDPQPATSFERDENGFPIIDPAPAPEPEVENPEKPEKIDWPDIGPEIGLVSDPEFSIPECLEMAKTHPHEAAHQFAEHLVGEGVDPDFVAETGARLITAISPAEHKFLSKQVYAFLHPEDAVRPFPDYTVKEIPFPMDVLSKALLDAAEEIARFAFVPIQYAIFACLAAVGVALGDTKKIEERKDGLKHFINVIVVISADSGERKSNVYNLAMRSITDYEAKLKKEWKKESQSIKATNEIYQAMATKKKREASKEGMPPTGATVLISELEGLNSRIVDVPSEPELIIANSTEEDAAVACYEQGGVIAVCSAEASSVFELWQGKYRDGGDGSSFMLHAAVGDTYKHGRRKDKLRFTIPEPVMNGVLFVQPIVIRKLQADVNLKKKGLLARLDAITGKSMIGLRLISDKNEIPLHNDKLQPFHDRLTEILQARVGGRSESWVAKEEPPCIRLSDASVDMWMEHNNRIEGRFKSDLAGELDNHNKVVTKALKYAGVLHAFDNDSLIMEPEMYEKGIKIVDWLLDSHVGRRTADMKMADIDSARRIMRWMLDSPDTRYRPFCDAGLVKSNLVSQLRHMALESDIEPALRIMSSYGYLKLKPKERGRYSVEASISEMQSEVDKLEDH